MMKNLLTALLLLIVVSSCQKEYELPDLVIEGPSSGMPVSYKLISSDDPGVGYVTKFFYDGQQRLTTVLNIEYDSTGGAPTVDTFMVEKYLYNSSDNTPNRLVTSYYSTSDTTYFQFDNSGRLIKDSSVFQGLMLVSHTISYTTNGLKVVTKEQGYPDLVDEITITAEDMTSLNRGYTGFPQYNQAMSFNYDTGENPLYAQNIRKVRAHIDMIQNGWPFYSSKHALKTFTQTGYGPSTYDVTNVFNSKNKLTTQTINVSGGIAATITYQY